MRGQNWTHVHLCRTIKKIPVSFRLETDHPSVSTPIEWTVCRRCRDRGVSSGHVAVGHPTPSHGVDTTACRLAVDHRRVLCRRKRRHRPGSSQERHRHHRDGVARPGLGVQTRDSRPQDRTVMPIAPVRSAMVDTVDPRGARFRQVVTAALALAGVGCRMYRQVGLFRDLGLLTSPDRHR